MDSRGQGRARKMQGQRKTKNCRFAVFCKNGEMGVCCSGPVMIQLTGLRFRTKMMPLMAVAIPGLGWRTRWIGHQQRQFPRRYDPALTWITLARKAIFFGDRFCFRDLFTLFIKGGLGEVVFLMKSINHWLGEDADPGAVGWVPIQHETTDGFLSDII